MLTHPQTRTLSAVAAALCLLLAGCAGAKFDRGETPIVIGEGASMKLESNKSFDDWTYTYVDADGKPNKDDSAVWIHPDVTRVIQSVELTRAGGGTRSEDWPSGGRLVVTYGKNGSKVIVVAIALNPAKNGLALIQANLKRKDFDKSSGGVVLISKDKKLELKKVELEGATNPVLCDTGCELGQVKVIFQPQMTGTP